MYALKFQKVGRLIINILAMLAVLVTSVVWVRSTKATAGSGVIVQSLGSGNLSEPVNVKIKSDSKNSMDATQIQLYKVTLPPGANAGWHQHGGPHMIIIASGALTYYEGSDPTCTGVVYAAGTSILDPGFDTHFVRNEGTVDAVTYVTQLLPAGGTFRIDVPSPGNCNF